MGTGWSNEEERVRNKLAQWVVAAFKRMLIIVIITAVYLLSVFYVQVCARHAQMPLAFTLNNLEGLISLSSLINERNKAQGTERI